MTARPIAQSTGVVLAIVAIAIIAGLVGAAMERRSAMRLNQPGDHYLRAWHDAVDEVMDAGGERRADEEIVRRSVQRANMLTPFVAHYFSSMKPDNHLKAREIASQFKTVRDRGAIPPHEWDDGRVAAALECMVQIDDPASVEECYRKRRQ